MRGKGVEYFCTLAEYYSGTARRQSPGAPASPVPGTRERESTGFRPGGRGYVKERSRRLLVTTKTDEKAIAAPAIIGFSSPAAASGSAATL